MMTDDRSLTTISLNTLDELFVHLDDPSRPLTIHFEVQLDASLDEERLRDAILVAAGRHPLARARLRPMESDTQPYEWVIDRVPQVDPLETVHVHDPAALDALRSDVVSRPISLRESPPFRVLLVHTERGDSLILYVHHSAADGVGTLRLLQSIARAYAGLPDPMPDIDPAEAVRLALPLHDRVLADRVYEAEGASRVVAPVLPALSRLRSRPARLAADGGSPAPGYGLHSISLPVGPLVNSPLRRRLGATVNDVLMAAAHRSVDAWNTMHDDPPERISISMPLNARPPEWRREVMGNLFSAESGSTSKADRESPERCLDAVARWSEQVKARGIGQGLGASTRRLIGDTSQRLGLSQRLRASVEYLADTIAVSSQGRLPADWIDSRDFPVVALWGSAPTTGVSLAVGVVTTDDRLAFTLRHNPELLSAAAAATIADLFLGELEQLSEHAFRDVS